METVDSILARTAAFVRERMEGEGSGHDWWHIHRVRAAALAIGAREGADLYVVELAALLHDLDDWKLDGADGTPREARAWLESLGVDDGAARHVCEIIESLSFKGAGVPTPMRTLEGKAVQDADRLDAIGAVGIARAFAFGGSRGRLLHDPEEPPQRHDSFEAYRSGRGSTLNHFHEKLLLLKDLMSTDAARALAQKRHAFMEEFLARFLAEWGGEA